MKIIKSQLQKIIKEEISNLALEAETMSFDPGDVAVAKKMNLSFLGGLKEIFTGYRRKGREYAVDVAEEIGMEYEAFWKRFNEEKVRLGEEFPYKVIDTDEEGYGELEQGGDRWIISVVDADKVPGLDEKKKDDFLGDVKSTGEWTDITIAQLKKKISAANKKQEKYKKKHDGKAKKSITKLLRQMNFSKNAKEGDYK